MSLLLQSALKCTNKWQLIGFARSFAYKSDLAPEVLYPKSKTELFTPSPPPVRHFVHHIQLESNFVILIDHIPIYSGN